MWKSRPENTKKKVFVIWGKHSRRPHPSALSMNSCKISWFSFLQDFSQVRILLGLPTIFILFIVEYCSTLMSKILHRLFGLPFDLDFLCEKPKKKEESWDMLRNFHNRYWQIFRKKKKKLKCFPNKSLPAEDKRQWMDITRRKLLSASMRVQTNGTHQNFLRKFFRV